MVQLLSEHKSVLLSLRCCDLDQCVHLCVCVHASPIAVGLHNKGKRITKLFAPCLSNKTPSPLIWQSLL